MIKIFETQGEFAEFVTNITGVTSTLFEGFGNNEDSIVITVINDINHYADGDVFDYSFDVSAKYTTKFKQNTMKINKAMKDNFVCTTGFSYNTELNLVEVTYDFEVVVKEW